MANKLDKNWKDLVLKLSHRFGEGLDLQAILFLIGLQELGQGYQKLTKNQKLDVIPCRSLRFAKSVGYL